MRSNEAKTGEKNLGIQNKKNGDVLSKHIWSTEGRVPSNLRNIDLTDISLGASANLRDLMNIFTFSAGIQSQEGKETEQREQKANVTRKSTLLKMDM